MAENAWLFDDVPKPPEPHHYVQVMKCPTCHEPLDCPSPHDPQAARKKYAAIRAHRAKRGCPKGIAVPVWTWCSGCQGWLPGHTTTSLKEGDWWRIVGHPHDGYHGVDRRQRKSPDADLPH